ncbi:F-box/LRR-repeat protein At4g14103 [Medicago truncatula]|uniref:F-box/LRR-repeat protein At4g14103 n=1 Tax=Medicago truncatula TaxID=3880 RepID=UPI000D2F1CA1|nr:F-box/LRR-repeat protein At4g14103 [Medicago truncatula]
METFGSRRQNQCPPGLTSLSSRLRLSIPGEDRISALPDSLLYHILSFLPMKDTAATTVLSKRWKPLFLSQLILNFEDNPFPNPSQFRRFLNSFIAERDNNLPILSFNLKCRFRYFKYDITKFVTNVVQRGVQNLSIDLLFHGRVPTCVLTTKTLAVLKLKRLTFDVPHVHLPSLKVLHLEHVTFGYFEYITKLLSGCPILNELETKDLFIEQYSRVLRVVVLSLPNLVRANISDDLIRYDWLHMAQHLRIRQWYKIASLWLALKWIKEEVGYIFLQRSRKKFRQLFFPLGDGIPFHVLHTLSSGTLSKNESCYGLSYETQLRYDDGSRTIEKH